ncbi:hypothetical protein NEOLI_001344 [Neolecta irregularis DAH-3]|uniref:Uncharacterized protein n=1 Tax=Neolecta irregularis (strain DAH-3) TaxID=1198029 RepID=A0A1U7LV40_NEOID|nr:hypothetical protein NEOLI_001344 [Neolecta irregularis DAH-3]|eukprot:OLL26527.1 hypothetical protein NEOLI_001344 [Neolecta irregularis DAH-3]
MVSPFVFALALATLVSAESSNSGASSPKWFTFAAMKSGDINVHQSSLSSSGNDLILSKNPPDRLKLTLDDSGSLVDPDKRIVSVDPVTGRCSISSTPEKTNIVGVFSFNFPRLDLSSGGSTYSFLACLNGGNAAYLLYAIDGKEKVPPGCTGVAMNVFAATTESVSSGTTTASSGQASSTLPSSSLPISLPSSSMNSDSSLANGKIMSPSSTVSLSGEPIDSSFNKSTGTNTGPLSTSQTGTSLKKNATTGISNSSTKNGRAEVLAGIMGLVAVMAILP